MGILGDFEVHDRSGLPAEAISHGPPRPKSAITGVRERLFRGSFDDVQALLTRKVVVGLWETENKDKRSLRQPREALFDEPQHAPSWRGGQCSHAG